MNWREWAKKTDRRHILALSGGKDSSALAVYLRDKVPQLEYVFCDTKKELKETYSYIDKLENFLNIKVHYLCYEDKQGFDDILHMKRGFLPSANSRWCTEYLKLKPYEKFIGNDPVVSYVGIRADEPHRQGYISGKPGVTTVFPFAEDGLVKSDIYRILEDCGLGLPSYYQWRSRSGCYFCFFQQKREWVGLLENHEDLFNQAPGCRTKALKNCVSLNAWRPSKRNMKGACDVKRTNLRAINGYATCGMMTKRGRIWPALSVISE